MRKKYFIVTFGIGDKYQRCYTKVRAYSMEESRSKFLFINPSYDKIYNSTILARVKELNLRYIPFKQIKKEAVREGLGGNIKVDLPVVIEKFRTLRNLRLTQLINCSFLG
jgi:hypothetical protein